MPSSATHKIIEPFIFYALFNEVDGRVLHNRTQEQNVPCGINVADKKQQIL
jgi:hypothetical protein